MKLKELISIINPTNTKGNIEREVTSIAYDSRKATAGSLFVCISGYLKDGHDYAIKAYENGARSFIVEKNIDLPEDTTLLFVDNSRKALSNASALFFDFPSKKLLTVGLTGTKGKTSTSFMLKSILEKAGYTVGLIGTNGIHYGDFHQETENSTPESYEIHYHLNEMIKNQCNAAIIEATSQAFKLHRVADLYFDISIFTNMGYDHIGDNEHKDFNEYLMCKKQIFKQSKCVAVNKDTEHFEEITADENCEIITFGFKEDADFIGSSPSYQTVNNTFKTSFYCKNKLELHKFDLAIPGRFSIENALGAISAMRKIGISYDDIRTGLRIAIVTGRMEILPDTSEKIVIIDYAHNEMSMKSLFETVKMYSNKRIINVFGAGGNRSKLRRYTMGEVSGNLADLSIITSDNPRYEKLDDIINDILIGMNKTNGEYIIVKDRKEAIHKALSIAKDGEIVLLCGKGQQDYEEIEGVKYHLNEREVVKDYFSSFSGK